MLWYSIAETARILNLPKLEVQRMLKVGELGSYLHCKGITAVAFSRDGTGATVGHGWFRYSGTIHVRAALINSILDSGSAGIAAEPFRITDANGAEDWSSECPYSHLPIGEFSSWTGVPIPDELCTLILRYLPTEEPTHRAAFAQIASTVPKAVRAGPVGDLIDTWSGMPSGETRLDYSAAPLFKVGDIVVPGAALTAAPAASGGGSPRWPATPPKKRVDGLDMVIWRMLQSGSDLSAKAIWAGLQDEIDEGDQGFDKDLVLRQIQGDSLLWTDGKGGEQWLTFSSFRNRVSRLKKLVPS